MTLASRAQLFCDGVGVFVFGYEFLNLSVFDLLNTGHQISHTVTTHRITELDLGTDFVAFGDRNISHVVAKACDFQTLRIVPGASSPNPATQLGTSSFI